MPALVSGTRLGPYEVLHPIGEGGMGEVYLATDTRLKRQVALKVLPASVTTDPDRLARFQREAEVLASLNHPNIAGLHGLEDSSGVQALVMELVDGPTLAERIAQGPVPLGEALAIARQIAEALEAAHELSIIHRDLKPANIKLRPDGTVKVLDFGLAKAMDPSAATSGLSMSPTITSPAQMTGAGVILGTAAYMSPEQAAGRPVDRRTDLWAFGVVMLEMLTGRRVFAGESVSEVIASVLKDEPDWAALPPDTPPAIRRLLRRCLERDRKKRWSDAASARFECDDALVTPPAAPVVRAPGPGGWRRALGVGLGGVFLGGLLLAGWWQTSPTAPVPMTTFAIELDPTQVFTRAGRHVLAVSPDGAQVVFVAANQLFARSMNELVARPLDGTAKSDPSEPTFSPDGQWIAFWSGGKLKKIPAAGGTPAPLADIQNPYGMSWSGDRIVVAQELPPTIVTVPTDGGEPTVLIALDGAKQEQAQSPQLIAGGRAVLFTLRTGSGSWNDAEVVVQDVASGRRTVLVRSATDARALANGYLVYSREDALFAAPFNADRPEAIGTAVPVRQNILQSIGGFTGAAQFAVSASGLLAFIPGDGVESEQTLSWMDRKGQIEAIDLPPRRYWPGGPALAVSPDGKRVAIRIVGTTRAQSDIWIWTVAQNAMTRLTFTGAATDPVWSHDGGSVCYESGDEVFCHPLDGATPARPLFKLDGLSTVSDIAPDGTLLLNVNTATGFDIWTAPAALPRQPAPLVALRNNDSGAAISPDGRWLAYQSEESGSGEVYVRPFPAVDAGKWQVSVAGGVAPRWSSDGRELYYLATRSGGAATAMTLMAVPIAAGANFQAGAPVSLAPFPDTRASYDVTPDGRFLLSKPTSDALAGTARQRAVVVQNWFEELKAKVPR